MIPAVILASGRGERLGLLTRRHPLNPADRNFNLNAASKTMAPLVSRPLLWHVINSVGNSGITDIRVDGNYLTEQIKNYFGGGEVRFDRPLDISVHQADFLGGTTACLNLVAQEPGNTLVHYGDTIIDNNFSLLELIGFHVGQRTDVTILVKQTNDVRKCGVVEFQKDSGRITSLREKPFLEAEKPVPGWLNCGVYILSKKAREACLANLESGQDPQNTRNDFMRNIFPRLLADGGLSFWAYPLGNYFWMSVDSLPQLLALQRRVLLGEVKVDLAGQLFKTKDSRVLIEGNPTIGRNAQLRGFVYISPEAEIASSAVIENTVITGKGIVAGECRNSLVITPFGVENPLPFEVPSGIEMENSILAGGCLNSNLTSQIAGPNGEEMIVEAIN